MLIPRSRKQFYERRVVSFLRLHFDLKKFLVVRVKEHGVLRGSNKVGGALPSLKTKLTRHQFNERSHVIKESTAIKLA